MTTTNTNSSARTLTIPNLVNGQIYRARVSAVNNYGQGPFANWIQVTPSEFSTDQYYYDNTLLMHFDDNRTAPFDQYGDYVSLLMHMDGTNNQISFSNSDSSKYKREVSRYGDTKLSSDQAYFGTTSAYFDGSGDYLTILNSSDMSFGTGDFTVELWVNVSDLTRDNFIFGTNTTGNFMIRLGSGQLHIGRHNLAWDTSITHNIQPNTWTHIAVARSQGTMRFFINGSIIGSSFTNNNSYPTDTLYLGMHANSSFFNGYMDDLRVTNGIARYTSNFSIPTEAFPAISPLFVDSSAYNNPLIVSSTSISSSSSRFGGYSGYFNGSSFLRSNGTDIWQLGTEDFTVESWINPNNISGTRSIIGNYDGADGGWRLAVKPPSGGTPSYGPEVSFTKTDGGSEEDILIPGTLAITRANNYSIYNSAKQSAWTAPIYQMGPQNPTDTEWSLGWSNPCNLTSRTFVSFTNLWGGGQVGNNVVNAELMMRHIPTGRIWLIKFSAWGGNAGGFAYTRKELTCSVDSSIIEFRNGNSTVIEKTITPPIPTGTWSHLATVRSSGVLKLFLDGTQVGSDSSFTANITRNNSYGLSVGATILSNGATSDYFNGYLDDLRITKGVARYPANFSVPVAPAPNLGPASTVPSSPSNLVVSEDQGIVTLSWNRPSAPKIIDSRSPITYYGVEYSNNGGSSWTEHSVVSGGSLLTRNISGLPANTPYLFRVRAQNSVGFGPYSSTANISTLSNAPSGVSAIGDDNQAYLSWTAPTPNNSSIRDYGIQYSSDSGTSWNTYPHSPSIDTLINVTGLDNTFNYSFKVAAVNLAGTGIYSADSSSISLAPRTDSLYNKTRILLHLDSN